MDEKKLTVKCLMEKLDDFPFLSVPVSIEGCDCIGEANDVLALQDTDGSWYCLITRANSLYDYNKD